MQGDDLYSFDSCTLLRWLAGLPGALSSLLSCVVEMEALGFRQSPVLDVGTSLLLTARSAGRAVGGLGATLCSITLFQQCVLCVCVYGEEEGKERKKQRKARQGYRKSWESKGFGAWYAFSTFLVVRAPCFYL